MQSLLPDQPFPDERGASTSGSRAEGRPDWTKVSIPDHTLLRPIGRGSYGEVWLAQNVMGVYRAIKIVHRRSFTDPRPFERELSGIRKFEPISRSHDGLIDVLHTGMNEVEGYFYYVMEIGDDVSTGQQVDPANYTPLTLGKERGPAGKMPAQECLRLGLALSNALAELHKHGLVHRDIKPSNIIFVNGTPKLADIGLVADISEARSYVGTDGFIPPEGPGAPQADIYALGKVLYEASTGKDRLCFPELPTDWDDSREHPLLSELNEVILQACASKPDQRYRTAWDMHANLLLVVNGKSVKRLRLLERQLSKLRGLAIIGAPVLLVTAGVAFHFYREWRLGFESRQKDIGQNIAYGTRAVEAGDPSAALVYFSLALELDEGLDREKIQRLRFAAAHNRCGRLEQMQFLRQDLLSIAFSPDDRKLLVAESDGQARIIDTSRGTTLSLPIEHVLYAAYSPDGSLVAAASSRFAVILEVSTGKELNRLAHDANVSSVGFSPDGLRVVTGCLNGVVSVWNALGPQTQPVWKQAAHTLRIDSAVFSHDGRLIVTASRDFTAKFLEAASGAQVGSPLRHGQFWVTSAAFSPDDRQIVTTCTDRKARAFEVTSGREILPAMSHENSVENAQFSPDGRYILTSSLDYTARLWLSKDHEPVRANAILRHSGRVRHATFDSTGMRVATTCDDGTVRVWNLAPNDVVSTKNIYSPDGTLFLAFAGDSAEVRNAASQSVLCPRIRFASNLVSVEFNRNGSAIAALSQVSDGVPRTFVLQLREAVTGQAVGPDLTWSNSPPGFALSDDARRLATFQGRFLQIWDTHSAKPLTPPLNHGEYITNAVFAPSGNRLLTRGASIVTVWDQDSGIRSFPPCTNSFLVRDARFSPDGNLLAICGTDSSFTRFPAEVRDSSTGQLKFKVQQEDGILVGAFDPTGRFFATGSEDHSAAIWKLPGGEELVHACQHGNHVRDVVFSRDGSWLVTASADYTARVWESESGEPLTPPLRHGQSLLTARFVGDGLQILTTSKHVGEHLWTLSRARGPASDLRALATLLSGGRILAFGSARHGPNEPVSSLWQRLRSAYPEAFVTADKGPANWDRLEIDQCMESKEWTSAIFHLNRLIKRYPDDTALAERLGFVTAKLSETE